MTTQIKTWNFASFWERFAAHVIDNVFLLFSALFFSTVAGLLLWALRPVLVPFTGHYSALVVGVLIGLLSYFAVPFFYFTYFISRTGQTFGKSVMKIKVVNRDGQAIGYGRAFLRIVFIEIALNLIVPALACLTRLTPTSQMGKIACWGGGDTIEK